MPMLPRLRVPPLERGAIQRDRLNSLNIRVPHPRQLPLPPARGLA